MSKHKTDKPNPGPADQAPSPKAPGEKEEVSVLEAPSQTVIDEMSALFSEVEIGSYKLKPWSFGEFIRLYPELTRLIVPLQNLGITADNFGDLFAERGVELVGLLLPYMPALIAASLRVPEEEILSLGYTLGSALAVTIVSQNMVQLKNFLPLILGKAQTIIRAA